MNIINGDEGSWTPPERELTPEELKEAYALSRASLTEEDLQRFAQEVEGTPMEELLQELEQAQTPNPPGTP